MLKAKKHSLKAPLDVTTTDRFSKGVWRDGVQQFFAGFHSSALIHLDGVCSSPPSVPGLWSLCAKKFIPISESKVGDTITTVVWDADGKVEITQNVTYINGEEKIRVSWDIENISGAPINNVKFDYGADTYFLGADRGHGFWSPSLQMVYILEALGGGGYMAIDAITPPAHYQEGNYLGIQFAIRNRSVNDTTNPLLHDAAYAMQWEKGVLAVGEIWNISMHEIFTTTVGVIVTAPDDINVVPGTTEDLSFTLINTMPAMATYNLSAVSSAGYPVQILDAALNPIGSIVMNSMTEDTIIVRVDIPAAASVGTSNVTLTAIDSVNITIGGGDSVDLTIICAPKTCSDFPGQCGAAINDGCSGTIDCSLACTAPDVCVAGVCTCTPKTCAADYPGECGAGPFDDGCGDDLGCSCAAPNICCRGSQYMLRGKLSGSNMYS